MQHANAGGFQACRLQRPACGRAEFRRVGCVCHAAKPSSTNQGTSPPPVFVSPELAGSAADGGTLQRDPPPPAPQGGDDLLKILKRAVRATEKQLSNLQLAIAQLAVLAFLSGVGTIIDQEKTMEWYQTNYPDGPNKVLGFLDYNLLYALQLDHIYTSNYFLGISALLTASLIACSKTQQWPLVKMAKRWSFSSRPEQVFAKGNGETLPRADVKDLGRLLRDKGYEVFLKDGAMYGFKGIAGRFAPIGVHISLILILFGAAYGALAGLDGVAMLSEGDQMLVGAKLRGGIVGLPGLDLPEGAKKVISLDKFAIDYRSDGSVGQYRSVISERDLDGRIEQQKEIYVNEPMRFGGVTIYQTDWALSRIGLRLGAGPDAPEAIVPMTEVGSRLGMNSSAKMFGTFIPLEVPDGINTPRGISIIARDLQQVVLYDSTGQFVGVRRPGSGKPIQVEGLQLVVQSLSGASGIQFKHDPGVVYVYTGFGFLMITTLLSYISHSQVWALQEGGDVHVGGKSNRAVVFFAQDLEEVLEKMPERVMPVVDKPVTKAVLQNGSRADKEAIQVDKTTTQTSQGNGSS